MENLPSQDTVLQCLESYLLTLQKEDFDSVTTKQLLIELQIKLKFDDLKIYKHAIKEKYIEFWTQNTKTESVSSDENDSNDLETKNEDDEPANKELPELDDEIEEKRDSFLEAEVEKMSSEWKEWIGEVVSIEG